VAGGNRRFREALAVSGVIKFPKREGAVQSPSTLTREETFGAAAADARWWAVPPWRHDAYKTQQMAFERAYGEAFQTAIIEAYGIGASPDGVALGFEFELGGGTRVRATLPISCLDDFCGRFMRALESAAQRRALGAP
jgi:hypothetical protein